MKILYGYSNCTDRIYKKIENEKKTSVLRADQKYHGLMIKGLSQNGAEVRCFSGLPINQEVTDRVLVYEADEQENGIYYHYYITINRRGFRQVMVFAGALLGTICTKKEKETYAICDCLNIANAYGMMVGCRLRKIPIVTIVTDLPDMMNNNKATTRINNIFLNHVDGFIFLTEQMNERVNRLHRPYIVMEGHVDAKALQPCETNRYEVKTGKKIIIYAGSVQKIYGIEQLVKGFLIANIRNAELWIYGDGDYRDELTEITASTSAVKYMKVCDNVEVVEQERRCALLVNPRPTAPEYTKYSFPSKNMEYMVSGTPVLTTKLPGMPEEYLSYIYQIKEESPKGIAEALKTVFSDSYAERTAKGAAARRFVLTNKTNVSQARRVLTFLKKNY